MDIESTLTQYIESEIAYDRDGPLSHDEPLLDGVLDSTDILQLVLFVEERFGIRVEDEELVPETFETVRTVADYVRRKQNSGS